MVQVWTWSNVWWLFSWAFECGRVVRESRQHLKSHHPVESRPINGAVALGEPTVHFDHAEVICFGVGSYLSISLPNSMHLITWLTVGWCTPTYCGALVTTNWLNWRRGVHSFSNLKFGRVVHGCRQVQNFGTAKAVINKALR